MLATSSVKEPASVSVRQMKESDLPEARRIVRLAFGTFIGVPDPENFRADREYVHPRWHVDPRAALTAEVAGKVVGTNFLSRWGSFGFFGPLTVLPEYWNQKVAQALLGPTIDLFDSWGVRDAGLFTFANSAKHIALYQKFGFWPRFLTTIMSLPATANGASAIRYSQLDTAGQQEALRACRELANGIYDGLDLANEINSIERHHLGDTILLWGGDSLDAFAVCHCGEGTEAGRDTCYLKFAAARPGSNAEKTFDQLISECSSFAASAGQSKVQAGVNLSRAQAYNHMLRRGFRADMYGVAMHRPNAPAYNREDLFVLDDWR